jgi:hypothetical protein
MTSTRKFGGHKQMWMNEWLEMISYNSKISLIWTGSTRGALGIYTKTWHFPFNHWWHLIFITHGCKSFGSSWVNKHVKIRWSGWVPYIQSSFCICHIGNHHVSLWMMPHKNFEH